MSFGPGPICFACRHLSRDDATCAAFPDGLPVEIFEWRHDHRHPFPGDGGITFEPADPQDWENSALREYADYVFGVAAEAVDTEAAQA